MYITIAVKNNTTYLLYFYNIFLLVGYFYSNKKFTFAFGLYPRLVALACSITKPKPVGMSLKTI